MIDVPDFARSPVALVYVGIRKRNIRKLRQIIALHFVYIIEIPNGFWVRTMIQIIVLECGYKQFKHKDKSFIAMNCLLLLHNFKLTRNNQACHTK
jgi:hypothetical protein